MKPLLTLLLLILFSLPPLTAQTNKKIRSLQKQQTTLKANIASQEKLLKTTKKDVTSQLANLQVINLQIEGQQKYVDGINSELTTLGTSIGQLEAQLRKLEADLAVCKRRYSRAVSYIYRNRHSLTKWQFVLQARNFRQMYRRLRYVTQFSRYQRTQAAIIQQKEQEVQAKRAELLGIKTQKNQLLEEGKAETRKLQTQHAERQQVVDELNHRQAELQASIAQQRKKAAALDARIDQLIQQEIIAAERRRKAELARQEAARRKAEKAAKEKAAREKAERERAERNKALAANTKANTKATSKTSKADSKANNKASSKASNNASSKSQPREDYTPPIANESNAADRAFASQRGRLPMPITGSYQITRHYGAYNVAGLNGVQLDSKGINITGQSGAQARAVAQGEVTAIFTYGGYYNVIVRHGSYMSVYCNLSSVSVSRGQSVSARQTLGSIAPDAAGNHTLHFQLRRETTKLNPEAWLSR